MAKDGQAISMLSLCMSISVDESIGQQESINIGTQIISTVNFYLARQSIL